MVTDIKKGVLNFHEHICAFCQQQPSDNPNKMIKSLKKQMKRNNPDAFMAMASEYVFEGQKRHKPLSDMAMLMLIRRMKVEGVTVHGFRSTFRDWASEIANAAYEVVEKSIAHKVGSNVERAYARSDLLDRRRVLMERWSVFVTGQSGQVVSIERQFHEKG